MGFAGARAAFLFEGPARTLVHRLKYSGQRRLSTFMAAMSGPALSSWLSNDPQDRNQPPGGAITRPGKQPGPQPPGAAGLTEAEGMVTLTYVPMHSSKLVSRGYNQAGIYARALARHLGLPLRDLLFRQHPTTPQNRLDFGQRRNNLSGSIVLGRQARPLPGKVILVDDVYTTGATAAECARIIKEGLGVQVYIWTFARTVRRQPVIRPGLKAERRKTEKGT